MKWFKKFEEFRETLPYPKLPDLYKKTQKLDKEEEKEDEEEKEGISDDAWVDDEGVIHVKNWKQY